MMRAAIYLRVSTDRQEQNQTIDSQRNALKDWAQAHGHLLLPEHIFKDEGYSGSRLDRPGLDALRDAAQDAAFDLVGVLCPDRLARKYAYQVLLIDEFRRAGCEVFFLQRPISDDPNDQLLLQIQGAIAEYERAVLGERFRRGKLQKARDGHYLGGRAPYGYRYIPKQENTPGYLVIDETEAEVVRLIYQWLIEECMTVRQILKRLNFGPWFPRSGRRPWSPAVVHHILADATYKGTAYANRYRCVPPKKPRKRGPNTNENSCRQPKPKEDWIPIPVPAIVSSETFELASAQLARNAVLSFRNNSKYNYLLRCLLTCQTCGLAMFGSTQRPTKVQPERRSYKCRGKDCILTGRESACPRRPVKAVELEAAVWEHIRQLLSDPDRLLAQFRNFAQHAADGGILKQAEATRLMAGIERVRREEKRLLDAYQMEIISLEELALRRPRLAERRRMLIAQQEQFHRLQKESFDAQRLLGDLSAFCSRIRERLDNATFADKQAILQLLIERIIVGEETLEIRHVIPLHSLPETSPAASQDVRLRSDGASGAELTPIRVVEKPEGSGSGFEDNLWRADGPSRARCARSIH